MTITRRSTTGSPAPLTVNAVVFGAAVNEALMAQAVRVYLSNQRQATAKTKARGEINRTKKKWFKQKGTGNARHGARTPSLFVGGGVAHGPTGEQNFTLAMPKQMRQKALISALSSRAKDITVCDDLLQLDGKTSSAAKLLKTLTAGKRRILIVSLAQPLIERSVGNIPKVVLLDPYRVSTFHVLSADALIFTSEAIAALETRLTSAPSTDKSRAVAKSAAADKSVTTKTSAEAPTPTTKAKKSAVTKSEAKTKTTIKAKPAAKAKAKPAVKPATKTKTKSA